MSTEYQYSAVTGESWLRAKRIVIDNELGRLPVAKFVEERVVNIAGGEQYKSDQGVLEAPATPETMQEVIPLLDPDTGEPLGTSLSYAEVYGIIKSAYLHFADLRDNPPEPVVEEDTTTTDGGTA